KIKNGLKEHECTLFCACSLDRSKNGESKDDVFFLGESVYDWTKKQFETGSAIVFVGAMGIAVRAIAPCIKDKTKDIPVVVTDENGSFTIPVLSGHLGGANELAKKISESISSTLVLTTATDINGKFAVDIFAKDNNLFIKDKSGIAKVSSRVLSCEKITIGIEKGHLEKGSEIPGYIDVYEDDFEEESLNNNGEETSGINICRETLKKYDVTISSKEGRENLLNLYPRKYVVGIGCKKGKEKEEIEAFVKGILEDNGIDINLVKCIASVDAKKDEDGIKKLSESLRIPFETFAASKLMELEGDFSSSDFVMETVGTDNVCERSALMAAGEGGKIIIGKQSKNGMTCALAVSDWSVKFR
ncbi:MAG: cobalamin biosynthesis protein, partial [Lachnospiraceae bacterium]|nr:cobalamin biosynthesis protein [Lachnospiraceae bacterium]